MITGYDVVFMVDIPHFEDVIVTTAGEKIAVWGEGDGVNDIRVSTECCHGIAL